MKGKKSVFNFLSDEDIENLSAFFETKNIPAGESLWKNLFYFVDSLNYSGFICSCFIKSYTMKGEE